MLGTTLAMPLPAATHAPAQNAEIRAETRFAPAPHRAAAAELVRLGGDLPAFHAEMRRLTGNPQARAGLCAPG